MTALTDTAFHYSRYAARIARVDPELCQRVIASAKDRPPLDAWYAALEHVTADQIDQQLRTMRRELMLRTLIRDITFSADFAELVSDLSRFADIAVTAATRAHSISLFGTATPPFSFSTVAMGKMGGGELNVSSDIDVVFLCDEPGDGAVENLQRLAKAISRTLDRDIDGDFVFRVDTRLRPYGDAGPMVPTLEFLERYFVEQGRMWERLAWLRSRVCYGALSTAVSDLVTPFVYRRYLDFDAVTGMRDLHTQLRAEKNNPNNIKLGRGGIRELEFGVQLKQLVRGGRDVRVRERSTLAALLALRELSNAGSIAPAFAALLSQHYVFLRRVEHMLQYRDDLQTQTLPTSVDELGALSEVMGFSDVDAFQTQLSLVREDVASFFDNTLNGTAVGAAIAGIESSNQEAAPHIEKPLVDTSKTPVISVHGFNDVERVRAFADATANSTKARALPAASRERLLRLIETTLAQAVTQPTPDVAATRTLDLLAALASRSSYLALMIERPNVLRRVLDLAATSEWAVRYVAQHPLLLDELIDSRSLADAVDYAAWHSDLSRTLVAAGDDTERGMDALRHFQQGETFRLLLKDVAGTLTVETLSDHLSALADVVIDVTCAHLLRAAALPAAARLAVIAYGRWGGKELGYASDLDLIFLMPDDAVEYRDQLTRIAQRLQNWLTALTGAGRAYEIDVRLRPDGISGLLLSTVSSFAEYQRDKAWTWEHQALTRARFAAGDAAVGAAFESIRESVISKVRDWPTLRSEILDMRKRVAAEHPNKNAATLFDLKHDSGGLVDMEFSVQALVLQHSATQPSMRSDHGNIALAIRAGDLGLLGNDGARVAHDAANAYRTLRSRQHALRLQATGIEVSAQMPITESVSLRAAITAFYERVFAP
jgi:[glutamine synthetase] adenylyltransferase / [glutamine synthetase]-adenylyl-L-tyrosine phosphorylase